MRRIDTLHLFFVAKPAQRSPWLAFGFLLRRFISSFDRSEHRRQLHDLPDHMLRDIGLRREQIDDAIGGRLDRPPR